MRSAASRRACVAKPSTLSDSTGNTHGIRLSASPPTNANAIASGERQSAARAGGESRLSAGAAPSAGFAPARTAPAIGMSIVAARTLGDKPLAAVSTPASRPGLPARLYETGSVSTYASPSRLVRWGAEGSILDSANEKNCSAPGSPAAGRRDELHVDRRALAFRGRLPALERARQRCARRGDRRAPSGIGCRRLVDRQRKLEIGAFGNADLFADEPVGAGAQHRGRSGRQRLLRGQLHEMQHLAVVSVVDQRTRRQRVRRRPFDPPRADSRGKLPLERRGQPGIARILPIRVPPLLHREAQRNRQRLAGDERRLRGDELGLDALGFHGCGKRARCKRDRRRRNECDANADRRRGRGTEHQTGHS